LFVRGQAAMVVHEESLYMAGHLTLLDYSLAALER
jgi:hypothetical protein